MERAKINTLDPAGGTAGQVLAVSPDGTRLVFVTIPLLLLNAGAAVPAGTPAGVVIVRKV